MDLELYFALLKIAYFQASGSRCGWKPRGFLSHSLSTRLMVATWRSGISIALVIHSFDPTKDAISDSAQYSIKSPLRFRGRLIHCRDSPSLRRPQGSSILSKRRNCSPQCTPATAHYHELKDIKKSMRCHNSVTFSIYTLFTEKDIEMVHGANDRRAVPD